MLLVNFFSEQADSKQILKTIKKYNVNSLLIINFKESQNVKYNSKDQEVDEHTLLSVQDDKKAFLFKMLDSMKFSYEYIDISSNIATSSLIALLAQLITHYNTETVVDLTHCLKSFMPYILQTTYYIPAFIKEIILVGEELGATNFFYPIVALDYDPDKETHLLKEILALFLNKEKYYTDYAYNKTLSSTILLQMINDEQSSNGQKDFKYPYIQACLSTLSQEQKGKSLFLQRRHNSSDKRALVYTVTDQGVLTLFIWYLNQKYVQDKKTLLFSKLELFFEHMTFSEIESHFISNSKHCAVCGSQNLPELFTCSICGQEQCKECLDNHFLENKCQTVLQLA